MRTRRLLAVYCALGGSETEGLSAAALAALLFPSGKPAHLRAAAPVLLPSAHLSTRELNARYFALQTLLQQQARGSGRARGSACSVAHVCTQLQQQRQTHTQPQAQGDIVVMFQDFAAFAQHKSIMFNVLLPGVRDGLGSVHFRVPDGTDKLIQRSVSDATGHRLSARLPTPRVEDGAEAAARASRSSATLLSGSPPAPASGSGAGVAAAATGTALAGPAAGLGASALSVTSGAEPGGRNLLNLAVEAGASALGERWPRAPHRGLAHPASTRTRTRTSTRRREE